MGPPTVDRLLVFLLVVMMAMMAITLVAWMLVRSLRTRAREPECGWCRYVIRGVSTPHCSECGADLAMVGVTQPGQKRRAKRAHWLSIAAASVIMLIVATFGTMMLGILPAFKHTTIARSVTVVAPKIGTLIVTGRGAGVTLDADVQRVHVEVLRSGGSGDIHIELGIPARWTSSAGAQGWLTDPSAAEAMTADLLRGIGGPLPEGSESEVREISELIFSPQAGRADVRVQHVRVNLAGVSMQTLPALWAWSVFAVMCVGVWIAIVWFILNRRRAIERSVMASSRRVQPLPSRARPVGAS